MATQDLGKLGPSQGKPVGVTWRWWYHLPYLALWMILGLALIVPKANRHRQAWLILIPFFLVLALWQMPVRLISMPSSSAGFFGVLAMSLAMAWTVVWLLGHRLARGGRPASFFLTLILMLAIGLWAHVGDYGFELDSVMLQSAIFFGIFALALLIAMGLARRCCRRQYRPGLFMVWLVLWMLLVPVALMTLVAGIMVITVSRQFNPVMLLGVLFAAAFTSGFLAAGLYLFNLPFMILAFKSSFYRERLQTVFGLQPVAKEAPGVSPFAVGPPEEADDAMVQST